MVKVEFTCQKQYKDQIRKCANARGLTVAAYVKSAVSDKMVKDKNNKGDI